VARSTDAALASGAVVAVVPLLAGAEVMDPPPAGALLLLALLLLVHPAVNRAAAVTEMVIVFIRTFIANPLPWVGWIAVVSRAGMRTWRSRSCGFARSWGA
jgi:hypothetical protein